MTTPRVTAIPHLGCSPHAPQATAAQVAAGLRATGLRPAVIVTYTAAS